MKLETKNGHFIFTVAASERFLGYLGENQTQDVVIQLDDTYEGWRFRMEFGEQSNFLYLTQYDTTLIATLRREWLPESGSIPVQISGSCGQVERRSNIVWFQIAGSVGALDRPDQYPIAFRQLEERMYRAQDSAEELIKNSEQILSLKQECDSMLEQIGGIEQNIEAAQTSAENAEQAAQRAEAAVDQIIESGVSTTIRDTLDSEESNAALSARQGSVLKRYAVDLRFRDRIIPEPMFRYHLSSYPNLVAHCATENTVYLLLESQDGKQIIAAVNRTTGALNSKSSILTQTYSCMTYDSYVGALLLGGASGVTVMLMDYEIIAQRALGAVTGITMVDSTGEWILYSEGDLIWIEEETTEKKRLALPAGIREPKSISYQDGMLYLMTPVTETMNPAAEGVAVVTALDEHGVVLQSWILPRGYGDLCSVIAETDQLSFGYHTERGALFCMADYRDAVDSSGQLGAARTAEEYSVSGYNEEIVALYVDASYVGASNGTQEQPFSSLKDALDCAHKWKACRKIQIKTTGNFASEEQIYLADFPRKLEIINDGTASTKIQCLSITGCPAVWLEGISCVGLTENKALLDVDQSHVIVSGCTLNLLSGSGTRYGIRAVDSRVTLPTSNTFQNVTTGIYSIRSEIHVPTAQTFSGVSTHIALSELSEARFVDQSTFQILNTDSFVYSVNA